MTACPWVAVQGHPVRADLHAALAPCLGDHDVVLDPRPDMAPQAWRTYRACLEAVPAWATHTIVVQDDACVPDRFRDLLDAALAARPDRVLALWHGGAPREHVPALARAHDRGERWVRFDRFRWLPTVAVCWPARLVAPVLEYVDAQAWPPAFSADDEILGRALRALREPFLACVPSLVDHPDCVPSLMPKRAARAGKDPGRVAAFYVGDVDPPGVWSSGGE